MNCNSPGGKAAWRFFYVTDNNPAGKGKKIKKIKFVSGFSFT